jgi:hypothetical protein
VVTEQRNSRGSVPIMRSGTRIVVSVVLVGALAACGERLAPGAAPTGSAAGLTRSLDPRSFSSLPPPANHRTRPSQLEVGIDVVRDDVEKDFDVLDFAISSALALYDWPNPAGLSFDAAKAAATAKSTVAVAPDKVASVGGSALDELKSRYANNVIAGVVDARAANDEKLRNHQGGYLALGGGFDRIVVASVKQTDTTFSTRFFAQGWSASVSIDAAGTLGDPDFRAGAWSYDIEVATGTQPWVVTSFGTQPVDDAIFDRALGIAAPEVPPVTVAPDVNPQPSPLPSRPAASAPVPPSTTAVAVQPQASPPLSRPVTSPTLPSAKPNG